MSRTDTAYDLIHQVCKITNHMSRSKRYVLESAEDTVSQAARDIINLEEKGLLTDSMLSLSIRQMLRAKETLVTQAKYCGASGAIKEDVAEFDRLIEKLKNE